MKFTVTESVACQLNTALMGLVLAKVLKMISILLVVATTSGIVLPVA
jgi:hypothetical protein